MRAGESPGVGVGVERRAQLLFAVALTPGIPLAAWYGGFLAARGLFHDYDNGLIFPFGVGILLLAGLLSATVARVLAQHWPSRGKLTRRLVIGLLVALPYCVSFVAELTAR